MFAQRWLRLLPGRSQLMLLAGIAFAVVVVIIFSDLAMTKNAAMANNQRMRAKVEQLEAQRVRLQRDLDRAQNDQQVIPRGWEYFGEMPKGVNVIVAEPEAPVISPAVVQASAAETPFWAGLWRKLHQP
jgi:hypothetical protein